MLASSPNSSCLSPPWAKGWSLQPRQEETLRPTCYLVISEGTSQPAPGRLVMHWVAPTRHLFSVAQVGHRAAGTVGPLLGGQAASDPWLLLRIRPRACVLSLPLNGDLDSPSRQMPCSSRGAVGSLPSLHGQAPVPAVAEPKRPSRHTVGPGRGRGSEGISIIHCKTVLLCFHLILASPPPACSPDAAGR